MSHAVVKNRYVALLLFAIATVLLWTLIPWVSSWSIGRAMSTSTVMAAVIDCLVGMTILSVLLVVNKKTNKEIFRKHWTIFLYVIPLAALVAIPFRVSHYGWEIFGNPAWIYILVMMLSVAMQQYVTFGLTQTALRVRFKGMVTLLLSALIFYVAHAILINEKFGLQHPIAAMAIIALGFVFAAIRQKTGVLHANIALHAAFYLLLIG